MDHDSSLLKAAAAAAESRRLSLSSARRSGSVALMKRNMSLHRSDGKCIKGFLSYVASDCAFVFCARDPKAVDVLADQGIASLLFGTIQLDVSVRDGRCLFAWGFSPPETWIIGPIDPLPLVISGICRLEDQLSSGAVRTVSTVDQTTTFVDESTGRHVVLADIHTPIDWAVEIAEGVVVLGDSDGQPLGVSLTPVPQFERLDETWVL